MTNCKIFEKCGNPKCDPCPNKKWKPCYRSNFCHGSCLKEEPEDWEGKFDETFKKGIFGTQYTKLTDEKVRLNSFIRKVVSQSRISQTEKILKVVEAEIENQDETIRPDKVEIRSWAKAVTSAIRDIKK